APARRLERTRLVDEQLGATAQPVGLSEGRRRVVVARGGEVGAPRLEEVAGERVVARRGCGRLRERLRCGEERGREDQATCSKACTHVSFGPYPIGERVSARPAEYDT